jgi:hypothetical protein
MWRCDSFPESKIYILPLGRHSTLSLPPPLSSAHSNHGAVKNHLTYGSSIDIITVKHNEIHGGTV